MRIVARTKDYLLTVNNSEDRYEIINEKLGVMEYHAPQLAPSIGAMIDLQNMLEETLEKREKYIEVIEELTN